MEVISTRVALTRCSNYNHQDLLDSFHLLVGSILPESNYRSARVLLKPNLISARKGPLACTEGDYILTAAAFFKNMGAVVSVGDSPAFGSAKGVLKSIGVFDSLAQMDIPVVEFNQTRQVTLPSGISVNIAQEALDCDLLVNLPRVKAHIQLRVTLAVKNYFGCVAGMQKPLWHMKYGGSNSRFEDHIVNLLSVLPKSVTLVDGIVAMHKTGPIGGGPYQLSVMACSENPVAVDCALLDILCIDPWSSPLMIACKQSSLTGTNINELDFPLLAAEDCRVDTFEAPPELIPVRFNPLRFAKNSLRRLLLRFREG